MTSATVHLQVYDSVVAAISAAPALAGGQIKTLRETKRPMAADVPSQIRVFIDHTVPASLVGGTAPVDWVTRIRLECSARSVLGVGAQTALGASTLLAAQCQARVLQDSALRALVSELSPAPMQWEEDMGDASVMSCQVAFDIAHRSPFDNLEI